VCCVCVCVGGGGWCRDSGGGGKRRSTMHMTMQQCVAVWGGAPWKNVLQIVGVWWTTQRAYMCMCAVVRGKAGAGW
jgi:hypothetical protein